MKNGVCPQFSPIFDADWGEKAAADPALPDRR
jgi:hypothetical protein